METIYIDSAGYTKRKTFGLVPDQGYEMQIMWEHCTEGFDNPNQIPASKLQRSILTAIFKAHNLEAYFTGDVK